MPSTFQVLIADPIHEDGRKLLAAHPDIHVDIATDLDEGGLIAKIAAYDALIVRSKSRVTRSIIEMGRALKAIGRAGIGVDNIDVAAATEHGIVVFNTPDANATTTAELTIAHMMSLSRHLPQADRSVRSGEWQPTRFVGTELAGKTVGIIGFGTIGRLVAERCAALKMKVLAYDPYVTSEMMQQYSASQRNLESLLADSDYVTLHCPLTDKTHNLIDAARLSEMKSGARLINCARGGLVDENALLNALQMGHIAGAALDVFAKEPPFGSELIARDNVVLTPHLGASTKEAQQAVSIQIAEDITKFLTTGEAESAVNLPRVSSEQFSQSRPYQTLALALGRLAGALTEAPVSELVVRLFGRIADLDPRPITVEAVIGLLETRLSDRINRVNATHLAAAQGIEVRETRSQHARDYLSLIEICVVSPNKSTTVAGTLLGGRLPHLVRIDDYHVEATLGGNFLFTRHSDQPGVVGTLGGILGRENINISRMNVGVNGMADTAIALIGVSAPLSDNAIAEIRALPAIFEVVEISL